MSSDFFQDPPSLGNQYLDDRVLRNFLSHALPSSVLREIESDLLRMGELSGGKLRELSLRHRRDQPKLIEFDAWGRRVDEIQISPAWNEMARVACEFGLVALPYERAHGQYSRLHQFALVYLFSPSALSYACPLAMSDGAAKTLREVGTAELQQRVVPRLIHRDPNQAWTSGQWMTERTGGSDVGQSRTVARLSADGWRLYGTKWFASAADSDIALTLARPEGNPDGGKGLALFLVMQRDSSGNRNGIRIHRLKEKLGTHVLPTAELTMEGTLAEPVAGLTDGVRHIAPMLNVTRMWNAIDSVAVMRRGLALARDYAHKRAAFGSVLARKPLHLETLAELQTEFHAAFLLAFHTVELAGSEEAGTSTPADKATLRLLLPITKLVTARQAVSVTSEILECFGGAGYIEDTGIPALLRDAQVLPIWEGTTNVLALDCLRVVAKENSLELFLHHVNSLNAGEDEAPDLPLERCADQLAQWYRRAEDKGTLEAGGRWFAMALGRLMQAALLRRQAEWELKNLHDGATAAVARRFYRRVLPSLNPPEICLEESQAIALQQPLELTIYD
jgi:alkylation response protein AidB-like acyl-CoA dehydrogenase